MPHPLRRRGQGAREAARAFAIALQQVIGHALRGFRPDAGQATQRLGKFRDERGIARQIHQNGILKPLGCFLLVVSLAIFFWVRLLIWCTASLTAAASKSSSISFSSCMRPLSMVTRFTS